MSTEMIHHEAGGMEMVRHTGPMKLSAAELVEQVGLIREVQRAVMIGPTKDNPGGVHYGRIPGTDRDTLLKPGAEVLSMTFRLSPSYEIVERDLDDGHREYRILCTLTHIVSGDVWGQGVGLASTMESRYRWRNASRSCPKCGQETIIKGKEEYGGGFLCWEKRGGCGAKYGDSDPAITSQHLGRVENPDIADVLNTVLKIAKKRSHVDAILTATAASGMFTQDMEDNSVDVTPRPSPPPPPPPPRKQRPREDLPAPKPREDRSEPTSFAAVTMAQRMGSVSDILARIWGEDVRTKSALDALEPAEFRRGYAVLHDEYDEWKTSSETPEPPPEPAGPDAYTVGKVYQSTTTKDGRPYKDGGTKYDIYLQPTDGAPRVKVSTFDARIGEEALSWSETGVEVHCSFGGQWNTVEEWGSTSGSAGDHGDDEVPF